MVFPEDTKDFVDQELKSNQMKVLGTCQSKLNSQKAQLLLNKRRKLKKMTSDQEHQLNIELSRKLFNPFFSIQEKQNNILLRHILGSIN